MDDIAVVHIPGVVLASSDDLNKVVDRNRVSYAGYLTKLVTYVHVLGHHLTAVKLGLIHMLIVDQRVKDCVHAVRVLTVSHVGHINLMLFKQLFDQVHHLLIFDIARQQTDQLVMPNVVVVLRVVHKQDIAVI